MSTKPHEPVAILVRVSTLKQESARQFHELTDYSDRKGNTVVKVCRETVSGNSASDQRRGLKRVEELPAAGKIKRVLGYEISRIARGNSVTHHFVETLESLDVSLYWHAQAIETLLWS